MRFNADTFSRDKSKLEALLFVIAARMRSMENGVHAIDGSLWHILSLQLKEASAIANALYRNCENLKP